MKALFLLTTIIIITAFSSVCGQVADNWRGPERNGIYTESGLMQEWPADGPEMLWAHEGLGEGFTSPVLFNNNIYITGMQGSKGYVYILSKEGDLQKRYPYGEEIDSRFPGTRSTPAVTEELIYLITGHGKLICLDIETGEERWRQDLFSDFDGSNIRWGYTESLKVNGDLIYCTPGGSQYNVVALNRYTGDVVWVNEGHGGLSAYCSPLLIDHNGRDILVTMMEENILGLEANTGDLLWSYPYENFRNIHPNTPIYHDGSIYAFSGYGMGGVKIELNHAGDGVTKKWFNEDLDNKIGGAVLIDGYIYGSGDRNRFWFCVDWDTGETMYSTRDIDVGTVIYADGRLYCYTERGELALVEPTPEGFNIKGQTEITLGTDQHWAHLVIENGVLYVRHGDALMAYDVKR